MQKMIKHFCHYQYSALRWLRLALLAELNATDETLTKGFDQILSQGIRVRMVDL
jgi:hypothetical protein